MKPESATTVPVPVTRALTAIGGTISVLFARSDSNYYSLPGCDVWDIERDATRYSGIGPVIAHPPCRSWGQLRKLANPRPGEKELALFALEVVRSNGGVLEHPRSSTLWKLDDMPRPGGGKDRFGGWLLPVNQKDWGHRASKPTFLYIVGASINDLPEIPLKLGEATHVCGAPGRRKDGTRLHKGDYGWRPEITKAEREHTPPAFAAWLVELAGKCRC